MSTPAKAECIVEVAEGGARARLRGTIEADFDARALAAVAGCLVIDLEGVQRITSFGVREWIRALKACSAESIYFLHAHPNMVAQFNVVTGFAGRGVVVSCYLPYVCEACETETERGLDLTTEHDVVTRGAPPPVACPKCGAATEFDDVPATYFSYLASQPVPVLTDAARRIISGDAAPAAQGVAVRKEVAGDVTGLWLSGTLDQRARFKRAVDGLEGHVAVICTGVASCTPEGAGKLIDLRQLPGARVCFSRVPGRVVRAIPVDRRREMEDAIESILWPMLCPQCGESNALIRAPYATRGQAEAAHPRCVTCGDAGALKGKQPPDALLRFFLLNSVPAEVDTYLTDRPGAEPPRAVEVDVAGGSARHAAAPGPVSKYRIIRPLGEGGMAEVFLAEQNGPEGFRKKIVLKKILPKLESNTEFVRMFLQEARTAARINHPNVVQIFDLGAEDARHYMAMEYVRGWDLRTVIAAVGHTTNAIPFEIVCRVVADICAGLHAAHTCLDETHKSGIIHRDISPHNVLISTDGAVKITDFGISKVEDSSLSTRPGTIKGKIVYMAPEQIDESLGSTDAQSDVFAVGVVLHEMLTGTMLFRRDNEFSAMRAVLTAPIPPIREDRRDISEDFARIVMRALDRDRSKRYRTAEALRFDLEAELMRLGRPGTPARLSQWLKDLVASVSRIGAITHPQGATPTGITAELGDDDDMMDDELGAGDEDPTQRLPVDADMLKRAIKGGS